METILIIIHASLGGLSILAGLSAILALKGSARHKMSGKIFFYSMTASVVIAIIVALLPGHANYFLLVIGIFSLYLIITGKRIYSLKAYEKKEPKRSDMIISYVMIIFGIGMIAGGIYIVVMNNSIGFVMMLFGLIGLRLAYSDIKFYRKWFTDQNELVRIHISKMVGGYIAAWTAFLVVNKALPGILPWILPTILGTVYIIVQRKKFS
jgi:hypothetical protein